MKQGLDPDECVPSKRQVERWIGEWRAADESDHWTLAERGRREAACVLPVLGAVVVRTEGRITAITTKEAKWICRLREAIPDVTDFWIIYLLALEYIHRAAASESSDDLDLLVAIGPWRNPDTGWLDYASLVDNEVPVAPAHILVDWILDSVSGLGWRSETVPTSADAFWPQVGGDPGTAILEVVKIANFQKQLAEKYFGLTRSEVLAVIAEDLAEAKANDPKRAEDYE